MMRLFVALPLPASLRARLNVVQFLLPMPRRVEPEAMHLTLAFLGDVLGGLAEDVHYALGAIDHPPLALRLDGLGLFGGAAPRSAHALVAPDPALARLQRKVETAARRAGAAPETRRFLPHITLGRFPPLAGDAAFRLERAVAEGAGLGPEDFAVDRFCLYRSTLGRYGAHYDALADYGLTG
ncbi:MAG: RNA 2',3'-cyclic phosphodiesterase [Gemmobacter sp.]